MPTGTVITIGNFDGVHAGHRALVARARSLAGPGGRVVAITFDPSPQSALRPETAPPRLGGFARRQELLLAAGVDEVVKLEPSPYVLGKSPRDFVEHCTGAYHPIAVVEGSDFRFGKGRAGDVGTLKALGQELGFSAEVVPPVDVTLTDQSIVRASSTITRWLVAHGRVQDAALVLGRPHELVGEVVRGDRLGRTINYPTANLRTADLPPADGVYAGLAHLPDGRACPAAISIGTRPTFNGADRRIEPYLLDAERGPAGNIAGLPEYGWTMRLDFRAFIRDQARFESVSTLVEQLARDCDRCRDALRLQEVPA